MNFINFFTFIMNEYLRAQRLKNGRFFDKIQIQSRHSFKKERRQPETLFCVLQTSTVKTSIVGRIQILCLKIDMTCKIENGFYWLVCFHYEYFRTQKLKNVVFQIKMVFIDSSTFIANIWVLKNSKMLIFKENNAFEQAQFWTVGVVYLEICLL